MSEKLRPKVCNKNTYHTWGINMKNIFFLNQTDKINTHLKKKHITTKHSNIMNVAVMYIFSTEWRMLECCYFWRGMKTYFSSVLMMLISSQSKTCKWNVRTQLSKLFYGGGKGSLRTKCLKKRESTQLVTSLTLRSFTGFSRIISTLS